MKLGVIGCGYVGFPLARAFAEVGHTVVGFDIDTNKQKRNKEKYPNVDWSTRKESLRNCEMVFICVPTDVDDRRKPDLSNVDRAFAIASIYTDAIVVNESTVAPGDTRRMAEKYEIFDWAFSPERINPGDEKHTINNTVKLIGASDDLTLKNVQSVYNDICPTYLCGSPEEAEAAKLLENTQRDVNIAVMNEFANYLDNKGIDSREVFRAMDTKWNALGFRPGLVGGHCIAVDPYYLFDQELMPVCEKARALNDYMPYRLAGKIRGLSPGPYLVIGETYKANTDDTRNSGARVLAKELGADIWDIVTGRDERNGEYDCVVLAVAHEGTTIPKSRVCVNLTQKNITGDCEVSWCL